MISSHQGGENAPGRGAAETAGQAGSRRSITDPGRAGEQRGLEPRLSKPEVGESGSDWHLEEEEGAKTSWGGATQQQLALLMVDENDTDFVLSARDRVILFFDDPSFHPAAKTLSVVIMVLIVC